MMPKRPMKKYKRQKIIWTWLSKIRYCSGEQDSSTTKCSLSFIWKLFGVLSWYLTLYERLPNNSRWPVECLRPRLRITRSGIYDRDRGEASVAPTLTPGFRQLRPQVSEIISKGPPQKGSRGKNPQKKYEKHYWCPSFIVCTFYNHTSASWWSHWWYLS